MDTGRPPSSYQQSMNEVHSIPFRGYPQNEDVALNDDQYPRSFAYSPHPAALTQSRPCPEFRIPSYPLTKLVYSSRWMAASELYKNLQQMFLKQAESWPLIACCDGRFPRFVLYGCEVLNYPDLANFKPKSDLYGPGAYTFIVNNDPLTALSPLVHGQDPNSDRVNKFVVLMEITNPEKCFHTVKGLRSIWHNCESIDGHRQVSTDGLCFVFHAEIRQSADSLKKALDIVTKVRDGKCLEETYYLANSILEEICSLSEMIESRMSLNEEINKIDHQISEWSRSFPIGLPWSHQFSAEHIDAFKFSLEEERNESTVDAEQINFVCGYIDELKPKLLEMNELNEDIKMKSDELGTCLDELSESTRSCKAKKDSAVRQLPKAISAVKSIKLSIEGVENDISVEADMRAIHVFEFEKVENSRLSRMEYKPMPTFPIPGKTIRKSNFDFVISEKDNEVI